MPSRRTGAGPIAAAGPRSTAWLAASERHVASDVSALWSELRQRSGATVAVARDPAVLTRADVAVRLPDVPEWAAPLLAVIPGQAAALRLAEARGVDIDSPHGLRKVTLTV